MTLSAGTLGSSLYISVSLSGFVELPAYVVALGIIDKYVRVSPCSTLLSVFVFLNS